MTPNETKFVAEMKKRLTSGKVAAPVFFEVGKLCGLKCKEVVNAKKSHFSGNTKAVPVKKLTPTVKEQMKRAKEDSDVILSGRYGNIKVEDNGEAEPEHGVVKDDGNEFVWIASPELIASTEGMH